MSKRYPGGIIRKTPQTPSQTSAQGVWDMASVTQAVKENTWPIAGVPDPISKSLRFRSSASAYLSRTPASAGNQKTWTWSAWVKRGAISSASSQNLFSNYSGSSNGFSAIRLEPDNTLYVFDWTGAAFVWVLGSSQVFRDPSAWYHIVVAIDTTQATSTNRVKIYVNGSQITAFGTSTYPSLNLDTYTNSTQQAAIGSTRTSVSNNEYFDGYLAEVYFIDGQALTPSSFGGTNDQTGVWQPIAYTGTYGTNGFYLPFSNTASTATLGYDFSGNSNNWTTNNISLTSGSTYDSMVDVPTQWIPYNTAGDTGALFRGNYCVLNPLRGGSLSNANLTADTGNSGSANAGYVTSTIWLPSSGKFYFEVTPTTVGDIAIGLTTNSNSRAALYYRQGDIYINGSITTTQSSYTNNDVIGVAVDISAATVQFYKNNTAQGSAQSISAITTTLVACLAQLSSSGTAIADANFGQRPFSYTPPAGFKTLCTTNLSTPTIGATASSQANKYFDVTTYTGTGASTQTVTNSGSMQPDFVWVKDRSQSTRHVLTDSVRGAGLSLYSNTTDSEGTNDSTGYMSAFNSNGFTLNRGSGGLGERVNYNGDSYVGWQWRASNATAVTNTAGSITSTVSANTTAGFSIVTFTGSSGAYTLGHGLGVAPQMIIYKNRQSSSDNWVVMHTSLSNMTNAFLRLNTTDASGTFATSVSAPTSTTIGCSVSIITNGNTAVAYCFAQVAGYSAFGSFVANGSTDNAFIYTGFRPRFIMAKNITTAGGSWFIRDTARNTYNAATASLWANLSDAENASGSEIDILSNGFKLRSSGFSSDTYIYMAFAESPFKYALAR